MKVKSAIVYQGNQVVAEIGACDDFNPTALLAMGCEIEYETDEGLRYVLGSVLGFE